MVGFQFVGRLIGDRLVDRFGERAVARAGGLITAAGMGAALAFPSVPGTIAGFAAAGFGVATLVPAAMHGADQLPGLRAGTGLTAVAWLMRVGFVSSPPVVGLIADATSLRVGLLVVPLAGLVVMAARGRAQPAAPAISIVSTPAMISAIPSPISQVSGSSNRILAATATSATPQAVHTPYAMPTGMPSDNVSHSR